MTRRLCVAFLVTLGAHAQTKVDLKWQSKTVDFSAAPATTPARVVASVPSTCGTGEFAFVSTAAPGQNLYLCVATNTWAQIAGGSSGSSTKSQVTTTTTVLTMAPGAVWASGVQSLYATSATVTVAGGSDTGLFTIGYNSGGQRVCYYGSGITIGNYTVSGFAGNTCTTPAPSSGFYASATVAIGAGVFEAPLDLRPDAFVDALTCGTNLITIAGGGCGVDTTSLLSWSGPITFLASTETATVRSGASNPATCTAGDLFVNTASGPALEFCSSTNTWAQIH